MRSWVICGGPTDSDGIALVAPNGTLIECLSYVRTWNPLLHQVVPQVVFSPPTLLFQKQRAMFTLSTHIRLE
jgi:hypothetical protein